MYQNSKPIITCPVCGAHAEIFQHTHYICDKCNWDSLDENTVDISYSDPVSAPLSNLFPHKFTIFDGFSFVDCLSMESFLQSLRVEDPELQVQICENYSGYMAYKLRLSLRDWRKDGYVYWMGNRFARESEDYTNLITTAYDSLYNENDIFRKIVLPHFKNKILIHSIGCNNPNETLLTENEYRYQLNRLMKKIK